MEKPTDKTSIKQMLQGMTGNAASIIQGKVTSVSPFQVTAVNDEKLVIYQNSLIVPEHLTDYTTTFTIGGSTYTMTVNNALGVGDTVYLLCLNNGKQYYVLDRI